MPDFWKFFQHKISNFAGFLKVFPTQNKQITIIVVVFDILFCLHVRKRWISQRESGNESISKRFVVTKISPKISLVLKFAHPTYSHLELDDGTTRLLFEKHKITWFSFSSDKSRIVGVFSGCHYWINLVLFFFLPKSYLQIQY